MDTQELKIPQERIAVLIGAHGTVKKRIEQRMHVRITVDSDEGDVTIEGEDSVTVFESIAIVKAIGRGFNPEIAELLYGEAYSLDILNIPDFVGASKKHMARMKGRIIGREGRARTMIEDTTQTHISVYGKTIAIIGRFEDVPIARQALEMLLEGAPHGNVYRWLENKKREQIRREFEGK